MDDLLYQLALTMVPNIGHVHAIELLKHYGKAAYIFSAKKSELARLPGIGEVRCNAIKNFNDFARVDEELRFIEKYHITVLSIQDQSYPANLKRCPDAPLLLFFKGNHQFLENQRIVSIVGTRKNTDYGKQVTHQLIEELRDHNILVTSGLAYGIDAIAHREAVKAGIPTIGIVAHGLDRIYPAANKALARQMVTAGGLLTEFISGTQPDKQNFPRRNRIVAGICDALVVVETDVNGGSIITAELANQYHKDVFAIPGTIHAAKSAGCNELIRNNKAALISSGKDLMEMMNWNDTTTARKPVTPLRLFPELSPEEKIIADIIKDNNPSHIDDIRMKCGLTNSKIAEIVLKLEMEGVIHGLPGKRYRIS